jgi:predicted ArsR family transcriptional regulator
VPGRSPAGVPDLDQRHVALAVWSRRRLLDALREADGPVSASELATAVGLHVTTARAHLRLLEAAGLVLRTRRAPTGPGRPRMFYAAAPGEGSDGHRELAELLAGALGAEGDDGRRHAESAGRRWAERTVPDDARLSREESAVAITDLFERLGFAPRRVDDEPAGFGLALERCPFRGVAQEHPDVVCTIHLGLMREALARFGQPAMAASAQLQPFVTPELCLVRVR